MIKSTTDLNIVILRKKKKGSDRGLILRIFCHYIEDR